MPLILELAKSRFRTGVSLYLGSSKDPNMNSAQIKEICSSLAVPVQIETAKDDLYAWVRDLGLEIIFCAGYSSKIDTDSLTGVTHGSFNIHFGPLPEFRGPSPVFWQLKKGLSELGLSIHRLTRDIDQGGVVWKSSIPNQPFCSYDYVNLVFSQLMVKGVFDILNTIESKRTLEEHERDDSLAAYYSTPKLEDVVIDWNKMNAGEIIDLVKACNSWNSGASTLFNYSEVKLIDVSASSTKMNRPVGTCLLENSRLYVACRAGESIEVHYLKLNYGVIPARFATAYGFQSGQKFQNFFAK